MPEPHGIDDIVTQVEEQYGVLMAQDGADVQALTQERDKVIAGLQKHAAILDKHHKERAEEAAAGEVLSIARFVGRSKNLERITRDINRLRIALDMAEDPLHMEREGGRVRSPRPDR